MVVMEPLKGGRLAKNLPPEMQAVFDKRPEGWSPAEWALRYVWNEPGVSLLLSGMNDPAQLEENLRVADAARPNALTRERLAVYDAARAAMRARTKADCTACRYCQPCAQGVEIPELLAALNAASIWDTKDPWLTGYSGLRVSPMPASSAANARICARRGSRSRKLLKETAGTFVLQHT